MSRSPAAHSTVFPSPLRSVRTEKSITGLLCHIESLRVRLSQGQGVAPSTNTRRGRLRREKGHVVCWAAEQSFTNDASTPSGARHFVSAQLEQLFGPSARGGRFDDAELVVSELATNAVRSGAVTLQVNIHVHHGELELDVTDDGPGWPRLMYARDHDPHGRGLMLVDAVSDSWRAESLDDGGKRVVVKLFVPPEWTETMACDRRNGRWHESSVPG
jgi:anti-sigma regulatory factor (Ser/Thr protein kinase)